MVRMKKKYRAVYRAGRRVVATAGSEIYKSGKPFKKKAKKFAKKNLLKVKRKPLKKIASQLHNTQINLRGLYS